MTVRLPVADAPRLHRATRRTRALRAALAGAIALSAAAAVGLAADDRPPGATAAAPREPTTEVVLDVSGSVGESSSALAAKALTRIAHGRGRVGLVLFSDSAQKTLPPGTPAAQLLPFARAFTPRIRNRETNKLPVYQPPWESDANPWHPSFSGGTTISAGLLAARTALERARGGGTILLISDLGDSLSDFALVRRELVALAQAHIPVRILALPNAAPKDVRWFRRLEGAESFERTLGPVDRPSVASASSSNEAFPIAACGVTVLLALLLGINELAGRSLRWGAAS